MFVDLGPWSTVRSCNSGQPSPTWKALHCHEGYQRGTGHGRAFVAWTLKFTFPRMLLQWGAIQIEYTWVMGYPCRVTGIDKETILLSDIDHAIECNWCLCFHKVFGSYCCWTAPGIANWVSGNLDQLGTSHSYVLKSTESNKRLLEWPNTQSINNSNTCCTCLSRHSDSYRSLIDGCFDKLVHLVWWTPKDVYMLHAAGVGGEKLQQVWRTES